MTLSRYALLVHVVKPVLKHFFSPGYSVTTGDFNDDKEDGKKI